MTAGDNLGNHVATTTLNMANFNIANANFIAGSSAAFANNVTASSFTATGIGFSGAQLNLASGVTVSSASAANYGGVYVSTNLYVNGKLYGDGSSLSNLSGTLSGGQTPRVSYWTSANALGNSSLSQDAGGMTVIGSTFTVQGAQGIAASRLFMAPNVEISSETTAALGAGVRVSTNVYIIGFSSAAKYYGDGSGLTNIPGNDNLGNHTATTDLKMAGYSIVNASSGTFSQGVTASSFTATGVGMIAAQLRFNQTAGNIVISSETSTALGAGVRVSTNIYIVGFSSATKYYGDGSALTGIGGTLSGGQTPKLSYWTGANTLGNANITQDAGGLTVQGSTFTVQGSAFSVGGSTLAVAGGNVGIGVAAPAYKLEVQDTGAMSFQVNPQAGYVSLRVNGVEVARLKP
jgi:hypothetical protein